MILRNWAYTEYFLYFYCRCNSFFPIFLGELLWPCTLESGVLSEHCNFERLHFIPFVLDLSSLRPSGATVERGTRHLT